MANRTDILAKSAHGTDPQNLIDKIVRERIYASVFWKQHCFGLSAEGVVEKALEHLDAVGGSFGGAHKPTPFLCLALKLLQLSPEPEVALELIRNEDHKYVRLLGAFYWRLVARGAEVYSRLEPLYNDWRRVRARLPDGSYALSHVDSVVDDMLRRDHLFGVALPHVSARKLLERAGALEPRRSALDDEVDRIEEGEAAERVEREEEAKVAAAAAEEEQARSRRGAREAEEEDEERRRRERRSGGGGGGGGGELERGGGGGGERRRERCQLRPEERRQERRRHDRSRSRSRSRSREDGRGSRRRRDEREEGEAGEEGEEEEGEAPRRGTGGRGAVDERWRGGGGGGGGGDHRRHQDERERWRGGGGGGGDHRHRYDERPRGDERGRGGRGGPPPPPSAGAAAAAAAAAPAPPTLDPEIVAANELRAKLGLKPLRP